MTGIEGVCAWEVVGCAYAVQALQAPAPTIAPRHGLNGCFVSLSVMMLKLPSIMT